MKTNKASPQIVFLILVFAVPMIISWLLFHYHAFFQFKTLNHGQLLKPAVHLSELEMNKSEGKWQIVFAPSACDAKTSKMMFSLQQLQKALGKDRDRVSLTLLTNKSCQQTKGMYRELLFAPREYQRLQKALGAHIATQDKIYLVDPIGNLFMYYTSDTNQMNILKDLKKVLEVSQIG